MKKKIMIVSIIATILIGIGSAILNVDFDIFTLNRNNYETKLPSNLNSNMLFIPELIDMTQDGSTFNITVDETEFEFFDGNPTMVKSYNNQGYLGNTIKLKRGSTFFPTITNNLSDPTTVHWHGLEVNGENDGAAGSVAVVQSGESKTYELFVDQQASTIWYHPHMKGLTALHAYEGLAGMIIIEDELSNNLGLPNNYGVNDIPLVLQAKLFDDQGNLYYGQQDTDNERGDNKPLGGLLNFEDGDGTVESTTEGFAIITNGGYMPYVEVQNGLVRFRTLNGSNHGIMNITTNDGTKVHIIGTDGGLLENPQEKSKFEIAAGQRFEFLIDLSGKSIGDTLEIIANNQVVLTLVITENTLQNEMIPTELVAITPYEVYTNQEVTHTFRLGRNIINDQPFDMMTINETFTKGEVYYFEVINEDDEHHSFHIHNSQFLVVEKNGEQVDYKSLGWKDTIYLRPGESMKIQVQFNHLGDFMYHCHILIHEEKGMMGMFRVVD